jgi:hypothetical protein
MMTVRTDLRWVDAMAVRLGIRKGLWLDVLLHILVSQDMMLGNQHPQWLMSNADRLILLLEVHLLLSC